MVTRSSTAVASPARHAVNAPLALSHGDSSSCPSALRFSDMVTIVPMSGQVGGTAILIRPTGNLFVLGTGRQNIIVAKVAVCSKPTRAYAARAGAFHSLT